MYCEKCGNQMHEGEKFCPRCGASVALVSQKKPLVVSKEEPVEHPKAANAKVGKNWFTGLLIAIGILVIVSGTLYQKLNNLRKEYADLQSRYDAANRDNETLKDENQKLTTGAAFLYDASQILADISEQFNQLDDLAVKNDSNSVDLINFYEQNAKFYTGSDLDSANYMYGQFNAQHHQTLSEYAKIKAAVAKDLKQLGILFSSPEQDAPATINQGA